MPIAVISRQGPSAFPLDGTVRPPRPVSPRPKGPLLLPLRAPPQHVRSGGDRAAAAPLFGAWKPRKSCHRRVINTDGRVQRKAVDPVSAPPPPPPGPRSASSRNDNAVPRWKWRRGGVGSDSENDSPMMSTATHPPPSPAAGAHAGEGIFRHRQIGAGGDPKRKDSSQRRRS